MTLIGQVLLVALYEWLGLSTIGTTVGKAVFGIQVIMPTADGTPARRGVRFGRFAVRSAIAVLPGGLAVAFFAVAVLGVGFGWLVGPVLLGFAAIDFLATPPEAEARRCLHDRAGRTLVVSRKLAQLAADAAAQARDAGTQTVAMAQRAGQSEFARRAAERSRESWARARSNAWTQRAESGGRRAWGRFRQRGRPDGRR